MNFLITLAAIVFIAPMEADLAVEWKYTMKAEDFEIPSRYSQLDFDVSYSSTAANNVHTWLHAYWSDSDNPRGAIQIFVVLNQDGEQVVKKVVNNESSQDKLTSYYTIWSGDKFAVMGKEEIDFMPTFSIEDSTVVWRYNGKGEVVEEPFPYAGTIAGSNIESLGWATSREGVVNPPVAPGNHSQPLFTIQVSERSATVRKLKWTSTNIAKASVKRTESGIQLQTDTKAGQNYRIQSSEDLLSWKNGEQIIGNGNTQSVERTISKPREFLRVIVE
jgi:hypothetical protein